MSFGDHLEELRKRLLLALVAPLPLAIVIFFLSNTLLDWLMLPVIRALRDAGLPEQLQVLSPTEMIVLQMKLSMITALVISAPWVLYQAWKFIEPGLYAHEKRFVNFLLPFSALLTVAGIALLYFGMLPLMLRVLILFGSGPGQPVIDARVAEVMSKQPVLHIVTEPPADPQPGLVWMTWPNLDLQAAVAGVDGSVDVVHVPRTYVAQVFRLSEYINLVLMLMLAIALAFQMPLVIVLLGWMGLASADWLRSKRRYALMVCGVVAVVITPPDALSALIMLVPLYGLYELGILLLVIAPASAVAQGRVFSLRRLRAQGPHNVREPMDHPRQPAQMELTVSRSSRAEQSDPQQADRGEGSS